MHVMLLSVARLRLKQLRDRDCVSAVLKENLHDVHSNCIRSGDVCSKFCISTKQTEKGLCKLDTTHAE